MKGPLTDKLRVNHILDAISETEKYLQNISFDEFLNNSEKRFATIKQIEIIGEACNHLSSQIKTANPGIDWKSIRGFRNISIHEYFDVSLDLIWQVSKNDLPVLKSQIEHILSQL